MKSTRVLTDSKNEILSLRKKSFKLLNSDNVIRGLDSLEDKVIFRFADNLIEFCLIEQNNLVKLQRSKIDNIYSDMLMILSEDLAELSMLRNICYAVGTGANRKFDLIVSIKGNLQNLVFVELLLKDEGIFDVENLDSLVTKLQRQNVMTSLIERKRTNQSAQEVYGGVDEKAVNTRVKEYLKRLLEEVDNKIDSDPLN